MVKLNYVTKLYSYTEGNNCCTLGYISKPIDVFINEQEFRG